MLIEAIRKESDHFHLGLSASMGQTLAKRLLETITNYAERRLSAFISALPQRCFPGDHGLRDRISFLMTSRTRLHSPFTPTPDHRTMRRQGIKGKESAHYIRREEEDLSSH